MDRKLQDLLRQTRADPASDSSAWARCAAALQRAGQPLPPDVVDLQRYPPGPIPPLERPYHSLGYETVDGFHHTQKWRKTPKLVSAHRVWWIRPKVLGEAELSELREHAIPGISFARDRKLDDKIGALAELPQLSFLSLASSGATDATLRALPVLPCLTELDLSGCKVTEEGLALLGERTPSLTRLNMDNTKKVNDYGFLAALPRLRRISACSARWGLKVLKTLPELPQLTHIALFGCPFTAKMIGLLAERAPKLLELSLPAREKERFTEASLVELARHSELRTLNLVEVGVSAPSLEPLRELKNLRHLGLFGSSLQDCSALAELELEHLRIWPAGADALEAASRIPTLRSLVLRECAENAALLARFPALEWLGLAAEDDQLGELLAVLAESPTLRQVHVSRSHRFPVRVELPSFPNLKISSGKLAHPPAEPPALRGAPWALSYLDVPMGRMHS